MSAKTKILGTPGQRWWRRLMGNAAYEAAVRDGKAVTALACAFGWTPTNAPATVGGMRSMAEALRRAVAKFGDRELWKSLTPEQHQAMDPFASVEGVLEICRFISFLEVSQNLELEKVYGMEDIRAHMQDPEDIAELLLGPASKGH